MRLLFNLAGRTRPRGRRAGTTLIEIVVVSALISAASGTFLLVANGSSGIAQQSLETSSLHQRSTAALTRIVAALQPVSVGSFQPALDPVLPVHTSDLTALRVIGTDADGPVVGSPIRIWSELDPLELDDGVDNDGDGLIDERRVRMAINSGLAGERTVTLVKGVSEYAEGETPNGIDDNDNQLQDERGLAFWRVGNVLHVRLTVEARMSDGRVTQVSRTGTLNMKNQ